MFFNTIAPIAIPTIKPYLKNVFSSILFILWLIRLKFFFLMLIKWAHLKVNLINFFNFNYNNFQFDITKMLPQIFADERRGNLRKSVWSVGKTIYAMVEVLEVRFLKAVLTCVFHTMRFLHATRILVTSRL